jgi:hypothetical protein
MKVSEALRQIGFNVGTLDDVAGRNVNPIIMNRHIIDRLNNKLKQYAAVTKAIQDVYSFSLNVNTPFIQAPPLALRSESYFYAIVLSSGVQFPCDMRGLADTIPRFPYTPVSGISNWIMPWSGGANGNYLSFFPMKSQSAITTTLTGNITGASTTIPVTASGAMINNYGRITIDNEKILYGYKDATNFYNCVRGVEMTTAAAHTSSTVVTENNVLLYYSRLPVPIVVHDDNVIEDSVLNHDIEVVEEHMEGIIKMVSYEILIKIDVTRAAPYKLDSESEMKKYAMDIRRGYSRGRQGAGIRQAWPGIEDGQPFGGNLRT